MFPKLVTSMKFGRKSYSVISGNTATTSDPGVLPSAVGSPSIWRYERPLPSAPQIVFVTTLKSPTIPVCTFGRGDFAPRKCRDRSRRRRRRLRFETEASSARPRRNRSRRAFGGLSAANGRRPLMAANVVVAD